MSTFPSLTGDASYRESFLCTELALNLWTTQYIFHSQNFRNNDKEMTYAIAQPLKGKTHNEKNKATQEPMLVFYFLIGGAV